MSEAKVTRDHSGTGIWRRSMAAGSGRRGEVGLERVADALGPELEAGAAAELVGDRLLDQDAAEAAPGRQGDGRSAGLAPEEAERGGARRTAPLPADRDPPLGHRERAVLGGVVASSCSTMLS